MKTRDELLIKISQGEVFKYLYFWGHRRSNNGLVTKPCLSQWYEAAFVLENIHYPTCEHYMMAQKAMLFEDLDSFKKILGAKLPDEAKSLGRRVKNFDEKIWCDARFKIVVKANLAKFSQHAPLKKFLLATENHVLVEASLYDQIWGVGLGAKDARICDPKNWLGENLLGFALMEVRDQLKV